MESLWRALYNGIGLPLLLLAMRLLGRSSPKIKESLEGRHGLWERLDQQILRRDFHKPLIWFHVASAGEYLQAQPVVERCLARGFECAVTVNSITGYKWAQRYRWPDDRRPVVLDYMPLDFARNIRRYLAILQPQALVYVKFDLWPNLIWQSHAAGIPQYLISGTLQPRSWRLSWLGRSFYRTLYAKLSGIFAVTESDRERFALTNPGHPHLKVVGDTRFDSVMDRKHRLPTPKLPAYVQEKFVFLVGSSWPPDEDCIFPGLLKALEQFPDLLLILAPHEPTPAHLEPTEGIFESFGVARLSQLEEAPVQPPRVIVVDTVGVLSSLYAVGQLAYVGGGFTTGVHNTMEPCAMGLPVIFGPVHYNSPEAEELLRQGLGFTCGNAHQFETLIFQLMQDRAACAILGQKAAHWIASQCGAAEQCFQLITHEVR